MGVDFPTRGTFVGECVRGKVRLLIDLYLPVDIPRWYGKPVEVRFYWGGFTVRLCEE